MITSGLVLAFALLVWGSFNWAKFGAATTLTDVQIIGNSIIPDRTILPLLEDIRGADLNRIEIDRINARLEELPFVAAARVSHHYPASLRVEILERQPLAIVNLSELLLLDRDGVVLPMVPIAYELAIPILSGFNPEPSLYPLGDRVLSVKMKETVNLLNRIRAINPGFYSRLSEITLDQEDEYVLILAERPTKVYLGDKAILKNIYTLLVFDAALQGRGSLTDYEYLDLRFAKQIIAREWS